jgi:nitrate/nitrite-specific signal transduction histidine kinase
MLVSSAWFIVLECSWRTFVSTAGNNVSYVEKQERRSINTYVVDVDKTPSQFPNVNERKLMMKIDFRVISTVFVLGVLVFLDRYVNALNYHFVIPFWRRDITRYSINIANAAVFGLKTDLELVGNEYNTALVIL